MQEGVSERVRVGEFGECVRACLRALCKTRILHGWIADMRTPSSPCGSCDKVVGACRAQCRLTVPPRLINLMSERRCECRYHVAALFPARAAVQARLPILRPVEGPLLPRARIPILAPTPRVVIACHLVGTVGPALCGQCRPGVHRAKASIGMRASKS